MARSGAPRIWVSPAGVVWVYRSDDNTWIKVSDSSGAAGPPGPAGPQGEPGPAGPQGQTGNPGSTGAAGSSGPQGEPGPSGESGPAGAPGAAGAEGAKGDQGDQGDPGPTGAQGGIGPQGDVGPQGPAGPPGQTGADSTVPGPPGPAGETGPAGAAGAAGAQGPKGDKGDTGNQGIQGTAGAAGSAGAQGIQGPAGPTGPTVGLIVPLVMPFVGTAWTNMPLADTLFNGSHQHVQRVDLTSFTQVRLLVNKQGTAGAAASKIRLGFNAAFQTAPANYAAIGTSEVAASPLNVTNTVVASAWINLAAGAKADVFIALIGSGGDGALDPVFGAVVAQFR